VLGENSMNVDFSPLLKASVSMSLRRNKTVAMSAKLLAVRDLFAS